jgi:hypothetical protein
MRNYLFALLSGFGVIGQAILPLFAPPDQVTWLRWRVGGIILGVLALIALAIQLYLQHREEVKEKLRQEHREREREQRQEERDTKLVAKVIAEYQAGERPKEKSASRMTHDSAFLARMELSDPLIYVDIEPANENMFARTAFILQNRGKNTAHKATVQPFKLFRKAVVFPTVEVIPAGEKRSTLPTVGTDESLMFEHDIFHWLMKDWNANGELIDEWPIPISISYSDPLDQRHFEATMKLVFRPIRYMMNNKRDRPHQPPFLQGQREPSWEFRDIKFKCTK